MPLSLNKPLGDGKAQALKFGQEVIKGNRMKRYGSLLRLHPSRVFRNRCFLRVFQRAIDTYKRGIGLHVCS
jgi:hypothetical protein